jgi:hypothetical protein
LLRPGRDVIPYVLRGSFVGDFVMSVDLNSASKGDKLKFRCGGEATLKALIPTKDRTYKWRLYLEGYDYPTEEAYQDEGHCGGTQVRMPFDIIAIEPAPFDWNVVRRGMAFTLPCGQLRWFIGFCKDNKYPVLEREADGCGQGSVFQDFLRETLRRSPEHDIKVPA